MDFKTWIESKSWKASKKQTADFWQKLPDNMPIVSTKPIPYKFQGSTYPYDGFRITGTPGFINSIMSRTKDILRYDGNNTKLGLIYKQQIDKNSGSPLNSFALFVQVRERNKRQ